MTSLKLKVFLMSVLLGVSVLAPAFSQEEKKEAWTFEAWSPEAPQTEKGEIEGKMFFHQGDEEADAIKKRHDQVQSRLSLFIKGAACVELLGCAYYTALILSSLKIIPDMRRLPLVIKGWWPKIPIGFSFLKMQAAGLKYQLASPKERKDLLKSSSFKIQTAITLFTKSLHFVSGYAAAKLCTSRTDFTFAKHLKEMGFIYLLYFILF